MPYSPLSPYEELQPALHELVLSYRRHQRAAARGGSLQGVASAATALSEFLASIVSPGSRVTFRKPGAKRPTHVVVVSERASRTGNLVVFAGYRYSVRDSHPIGHTKTFFLSPTTIARGGFGLELGHRSGVWVVSPEGEPLPQAAEVVESR